MEAMKCEEEELSEQGNTRLQNTDQQPPWTHSDNELTEVKQEKTDRSKCDRHDEETRHWMVCHGGLLKEIKAEHTQSVSGTCARIDCSKEQQQSGTNDKQINETQSSVANFHKKCRTDFKPYISTMYGDSFLDDSSLAGQHMTPTKQLHSQSTCGKLVTNCSTIKEHGRTHTRGKLFIRDKNGKSCTTSTNLNTGTKPYTCETCGQSFTQICNLKTHEMTHTGEKPYTCETCGRSFTQPCHLKTHKMTHTGEKPYTCDTCGKAFAQSSHLKTHDMTHTGEKPYTCGTCGKSFRQSNNLKRHGKIHTSEKPYTCETCGRSFSLSTILKVHERTHTGEKPYSCETCGKSFRQSGTLKSHEKTHEKTYNSFTYSSTLGRHQFK